MKYLWALGYVGSVVLVNVLFDHWPQYAWLWSRERRGLRTTS